MDLADWLEMPLDSQDLAKPEETPWLDAGGLELPSGKLAASDPASFHESAVLVVLRPLRHEVQARLVPLAGERRISRVRVLRGAFGARGRQLGAVTVASGRLGFSDWELVGAAADALAAEALAALVERARASGAQGALTWDEASGAHMTLFAPANGPGSFPVYELVSGDRRVGAEVVFVEDPKS